jgi:hypothetical protein
MTVADQGELRMLVQQVLREVLPGVVGQAADRAGIPGLGAGGAEVRPVRLGDDADLAGFVRELLALAASPNSLEDLRTGRLRFTLAPNQHAQRTQPSASRAVQRHEKGPVTEAHVKQAARDRVDLVLGPRAVLTPLARDSARALGVSTVREEPRETG